MNGTYAVFVEGLGDLKDLENLTPAIERAARLAINATADRSRKVAADEILREINFPARYLSPGEGRLKVTRYASARKMEAVVTGRRRATSLARFVTSGQAGKTGVTVSMKKGSSKPMPRAFLMKLKSGAGGVETKNNLGLAVRTARGQRPDRAYKPVKVSDNLWLLYGVSTDQAFRIAREKVSPEAASFLQAEFNRLLKVDF